jgi:hypothetical protein
VVVTVQHKKTDKGESAPANSIDLTERIHFCEGGIKAAARRCEALQLQMDGLTRLLAGMTPPQRYECGGCLKALVHEVSYDDRHVYICPQCKHSTVVTGWLPEVKK